MLNRQKAHDTVTQLTIDLLSYNEEMGFEPLKQGETASFDTAGFVEHAPPKGKFTVSWYAKRRTYDVEVDSQNQVHVKRREG